MSRKTWEIDPTRSQVHVRASSTLHDTESTGVGLSGTLFGDLDALESTGGGQVTVPLKKLSFGDRMRDFAMHRHLDIKHWPEARFEVDKVSVSSRDPWRIQVTGTIHYRGRRTSLTVEADGTLTDRSLEAVARFPLNLPSLGVKPPKLLFLKVSDQVDVEVRIVAKGTA